MRRQAFFLHESLDVLDHHDGIIDQQTDCQHHAEHGQRIDGIAEGLQDPKRAQQHHGHRDGWDEGGSNALQEQQHHQEHQADGFEQCLHHLFDRGAYERRGVERVDRSQAVREPGLQLVDGGLHRFRGIQCVGAVRQLHGNTRGGLAVIVHVEGVGLAAEADPRHIVQAHL